MITIGNPIYETILQYVEKGGRMAEMLFDGLMTNKIVDVEIHSHEHTENHSKEYIKYLANKTQLAQKDRALEESHKALEDKDKELEKLRMLLAQHGISD